MVHRSFASIGAALCLVAPGAAQADLAARLETEAWWGLRSANDSVSLARLTALPSIRPTPREGLVLDLRARLEFAPDRTGLGTRDTYAPWSRPLLLTDAGRFELDRATVQVRAGATRITLGKQALAWGVLDGVQVTDRFDPVRRRDFVATEIRPERIGRWTARVETRVRGLRLDAAFAPDPTVNQQAEPGSAFDIRAPRFLSGLPLGGTPVAPVSDPRDRVLKDASYGVKLAHGVGRMDVTLLAFHGPELDPLLLPALPTGGPAIRLAYPGRTLVGGSLVVPAGPTVWRLEAAHVPDQPLNLDASRTGRLAIVERPRTMVGIGMDWQAPARLFVNAQLVVDTVHSGGEILARPDTDVVATLRVHRDLAREKLRLKAEILTDLGRGDALVRPVAEWKPDDRLTLAAGADLFTGRADGIFGQFASQSRLFVHARASF